MIVKEEKKGEIYEGVKNSYKFYYTKRDIFSMFKLENENVHIVANYMGDFEKEISNLEEARKKFYANFRLKNYPVSGTLYALRDSGFINCLYSIPEGYIPTMIDALNFCKEEVFPDIKSATKKIFPKLLEEDVEIVGENGIF